MPFPPEIENFSQVALLFLLLLTASAIMLAERARITLSVLLAQYLVLTLYLAQLVLPSVAVVRLLSGSLVVWILLITARQVNQSESQLQPRVHAPSAAFRLLATLFAAICLWAITASTPLLGLAPPTLFASLWLMVTGLLIAILTRESLRFGIGIIIFSSGFALLETALEGSLFLYGLLNIADVLIALLVAHLAILSPEVAGGRRRGESV